MIRVILIILFILTISISVVAQDWIDQAQIITTQISENIYMIEGAGGNIGVCVGEDGMFIIDDQFAKIADKIKAALDNIDKGKIQFILNTHSHRDHVGGNAIFGADAIIIAHDKVRERMIERYKENPNDSMAVGEDGWPVITFNNSLNLYFNGEKIKALHYPGGHTDNDAVIYFEKSNVVHMGDLFFSGRFPYIDIYGGGGNIDTYIKNVKSVLDVIPEDCKIIPGHGSYSTKKDLQDYYEMLVATTKIIRDSIKGGKSLEEMKNEGLGDEWKDWSWDFITTEIWIELVFDGSKQ